MLVKMGCKKWTRGTQLGLRIYTNTIKNLEPLLNVSSNDQKWAKLGDFIKAVEKRLMIIPYSRDILIVSRRKREINGTMTIARHGRTTQGYITAPHKTWFYAYVQQNMNENYYFEYISALKTDLLVIPKHKSNIQLESNKDEERIHRRVTSYCRKQKRGLPAKANEIGLFYEIMEKEHLEKMGFKPYHRYPSLQSKDPKLLKRDISCDIDVFNKKGEFVKFVEVKSVSAAPGTEFNLTIKEHESRKKCGKKKWPYEIVVYYHIGSNVIKRQVISLSDKLLALPSGYICYPQGEE